MSDLIDRQQAIDALRKLREEDIEDYGCEIPEGFNQDHLDRATFAIKQLPPIQPEPHWIPVMERLPEKFDYYLVSGINSVWFARYENGRFLGILSGHALDTVIAWMPLPEPYKGVTDGDD